ncbi:response regulator [Dyadobacter arcticus]|uniref:CheY-like chemotaxis protein n=1 Tax=Dyadobacter arcticus TaxID=1078754 RepID=A0ABX0UST5_9BACT|nr:response regulator [Dyadobacter arcticus]NIJ55827.1 CheY-like chemotaxis protein [Dyadobacter arcticus]
MSTGKTFQILLADDDDDDTFLFQEALEQLPVPMNLQIADNGVELINMLDGEVAKPDLIFLDMNMPVKNGLECLTEIRSTPGFEETPIIILSTSVAQYLWESAYKAGANLYIQKPTSFDGLVDILKKCLFQKLERSETFSVEKFLITN